MALNYSTLYKILQELCCNSFVSLTSETKVYYGKM